MRRRQVDAGFSLVESLVTIALIGIAIVGIMGALGTATTASDLQARQADADAALRSGAELIKSQAYVACPLVPSYDPSSATTAPQMTVTLVSVEHWDGSAFQSACPVTDGGFQRITIEAASTGGTFERSLQFIKRRP